MFFPKKLHSEILNCFVIHEQLTVQELTELLAEQKEIIISKAQLYNVLTLFQEHMILIKQGVHYMLHPHWIDLCTSYAKNLRHREEHEQYMFKPGFYKKIKTASLAESSMIRSEYVTRLLHVTKENSHYEYITHNDFLLSDIPTKTSFPEEYTQKWHQTYVVCAGDTFLDKRALKRHKLTDFHMVFGKPLVESGERCNVVVIGDYLVQSFPSEFLINCIRNIFSSVEKIEELDYAFYCSLFQLKSECYLTITHDPINAKVWKEKIGKE